VRRVRAIGRALICAMAVLASYGWLDLLRHLPGPHLPLILPLRANGGGDDVSVLTVILVFTATFAAIARIAPPRERRRVRAAIVRAVALAAFLVTVVALQQGIVEQSRPTFSWEGSFWLAWPWLAAACAALGTLAVRQPARADLAMRKLPHPYAPAAPAAESRVLEERVA
jgi:hypothetical protein